MHEPTPPLREPTPAAVRASRLAAFSRGPANAFLIATTGAVVLAVIAPFGMDPAPLGLRLLYWLGMLNVGTLVGIGVARLVRRWAFCEERPLIGAAIVAGGITPPLTLIAWWVTGRVFGPTVVTVPSLALDVFVVSAAMLAINLVADRQPPETHAAVAGAAPPKFLERLPPKLRGAELYAVEAEDHYLRLHTSRGSDLILMRLSDAVAELDGLEGAQTHRSWWVARSGFSDAKRGDGRAVLALKDGAEAPVSRSFAKALREAGWF